MVISGISSSLVCEVSCRQRSVRSRSWSAMRMLGASIALVAAAGFTGCAAEGAAQVPNGTAQDSYAWYSDTDAMVEAADLVVDVSDAAKLERVLSVPSGQVTVSPDGTSAEAVIDAPVYEVVVMGVHKGVGVREGDRIFVASSVDGQASPAVSQAHELETERDLTLYLISVAESFPSDVWTTLSPYQGVEQ